MLRMCFALRLQLVKMNSVDHRCFTEVWNLNLAFKQVRKDKKPLTDWSDITSSAPCMMSLSPLTVHKPPQVCSLSQVWFFVSATVNVIIWSNVIIDICALIQLLISKTCADS